MSGRLTGLFTVVLVWILIYANGASVFYHVLGFLPPTAPIARPRGGSR